MLKEEWQGVPRRADPVPMGLRDRPSRRRRTQRSLAPRIIRIETFEATDVIRAGPPPRDTDACVIPLSKIPNKLVHSSFRALHR